MSKEPDPTMSKEDTRNARESTTIEFADRNNESEEPSGARAVVGDGSVQLADFVNNHLAEVRFVSTTAITLLAAYGISQTPLFFRYKTVSELPQAWFRQRKTIRGRLIKAWIDQPNLTTNTTGRPIRCHVRHASPMEQLLPTSWYNQVMKWHPSTSTLGVRPDEKEDELLLIEIAGVRSFSLPTQRNDTTQQSSTSSPPSSSLLAAMDPNMVQGVSSDSSPLASNNNDNYSSSSASSAQPTEAAMPRELEWLKQFAQERPFISCQLLGRRVPILSPTRNSSNPKKRHVPGLFQEPNETGNEAHSDLNDPSAPQVAIGRLYYRSPSSTFDNLRQMLFPVDMARSLVQMGRATVVDGEGLVTNDSKSSARAYRLADSTNSVHDLQADVYYLEQLHKAEHQAVAEQRGMWQQASVRQLKADIVQEVDFQQHAPWYHKLWRWMRGG